MLQFVTGNLLDAQVDALVNTVNTAGVMGKGLALQFKKAFPANSKAYEVACRSGEVQIGRMFVFDAGGIVLPRYIINFPTKRHWRSPSRIEFIEQGLRALVSVIHDRKIRSIAVPPLGAGLGGLDWGEVRGAITREFASLEGVQVLVFEPKGAPPPEAMRNVTAKPKMTAGRASVIALMNQYLVPGFDYRLSLLEVQKLAYFLQAAGEELRLKYQAHHYGPYADNLRHVLNHIEGHFVRGFGDGRNRPETPLELLPGAATEAEAFLASRGDAEARISRVAELIEGFETPFGMELLSTVHWVATHDGDAARSVDAAIAGVQAWSEHKATMMKPEHVRAAWARLRDTGWIGSP
jgi:O-acetyl-ADP-ribose deacetylase (regulator of RNase III)